MHANSASLLYASNTSDCWYNMCVSQLHWNELHKYLRSVLQELMNVCYWYFWQICQHSMCADVCYNLSHYYTKYDAYKMNENVMQTCVLSLYNYIRWIMLHYICWIYGGPIHMCQWMYMWQWMSFIDIQITLVHHTCTLPMVALFVNVCYISHAIVHNTDSFQL